MAINLVLVPAEWPVLSRWWAARVGPATYALTLHWRPLPPHLARGVIIRYQVSEKPKWQLEVIPFVQSINKNGKH